MSQIWLPWLSAMCFMQIDQVTEHWRRSQNLNFKFVKLCCRGWLTRHCHDMMHGFMNICASMQQYTLVSMKHYVDYTCSGYEWMVSRMSQIWLPWLSAMCFMQIDQVTEHWRRSKNVNFKFVKLYCRQWLTSQCHDMHDSWVHEYMCFPATIHTSAYEV